MHKFLTFIILLATSYGVNAQQDLLNMEIRSNLAYDSNLSDIWGYVAPDGHEYAVLGTNGTTSVVDLIDPDNPVEVASFPGTASVWRDMKSFREFVYVTNDTGADGLLVIDMRGAPNDITAEFWRPEIEVNGTTNVLGKCHNLYIDEEGYAYLSGSNINGGGVIIVDVFTTPGQPQFVSAAQSIYSHDVMVQDNLLYTSDILSGFFSVIDVSDKLDPITLSMQNTTSNFTHNAWVSSDNNFLFTTDERPNANVDAYDISDLSDIKRLDVYQPESTRGTGTIPHNTHYHNGYLVTSWYTAGVRIIDANKPDNLVEVAYYDTYPQADGGFNGVWGVTPFLPSGLVIASDINTGLYIFDVDYVRAAYLEGVVTDSESGMAINDVSVIIDSPLLNTKNTNGVGEYKTGLAEAGEYSVTFSKLGYVSKTVSTSIINGEVTILNVDLSRSQTFSLTGTIKARLDNSPIENGKVLFQGENFEYEANTNADGVFTLNEVIEGEYSIYSGAWGYKNIEVNSALSVDQNESIDILLDEQYMDDFIVDLGWAVNDQAESGAWERAIPIGTTDGVSLFNPDEDVEGDVGNKAYVTENLEGGGVGAADVDGGSVILTSPNMDLTTYTEPIISYRLWFATGGGNTEPNDNLVVRISNGTETIDVETLNNSDSGGRWRETASFVPSDLLTLTTTMQFSVVANDVDPGHLVEAGLDNFLVTETSTSTGDLISSQIYQLRPNPFSVNTTLVFDEVTTGQVRVTNILGQLMETIKLENAKTIQLGQSYDSGIYYISLESDNQKFEAIKIVKQ